MTAEVLDQVRFEELEQPPWDGFAVFAAFGWRDRRQRRPIPGHCAADLVNPRRQPQDLCEVDWPPMSAHGSRYASRSRTSSAAPGSRWEPVDDRIERDKEAGERVVTQASPQSKLA